MIPHREPREPESLSSGVPWGGGTSERFRVIRTRRLAPQLVAEHPVHDYQIDVHIGRPTRMRTRQDGRTRTAILASGALIYSPAGSVCQASWDDPREVAFVTFSSTFAEQVLDAPAARRLPASPRFGVRDPLIHQLTLALLDDPRPDDPAGATYREAMAAAIVLRLAHGPLGGLAERLRPPSLTRIQVRRAVDFAEDRLGEAIRLTDWAAHLGLGAHAFARGFRGATGVAPHRFLLDRRVERAKEILKAEPTRLVDIALALGFSSQSHFNRVFRARTGVTPGAWRGTR